MSNEKLKPVRQQPPVINNIPRHGTIVEEAWEVSSTHSDEALGDISNDNKGNAQRLLSGQPDSNNNKSEIIESKKNLSQEVIVDKNKSLFVIGEIPEEREQASNFEEEIKRHDDQLEQQMKDDDNFVNMEDLTSGDLSDDTSGGGGLD